MRKEAVSIESRLSGIYSVLVVYKNMWSFVYMTGESLGIKELSRYSFFFVSFFHFFESFVRILAPTVSKQLVVVFLSCFRPYIMLITSSQNSL